jgi:hypothetical protein
MACDFGCRPSQFVRGLSEFQAFTLDFNVWVKGRQAEAKAMEKANRARSK